MPRVTESDRFLSPAISDSEAHCINHYAFYLSDLSLENMNDFNLIKAFFLIMYIFTEK